jgi:hypothetical protein
MDLDVNHIYATLEIWALLYFHTKFITLVIVHVTSGVFGSFIGNPHQHPVLGFLLGLTFGVVGVVIMTLVNISEGSKPIAQRRPKRY